MSSRTPNATKTVWIVNHYALDAERDGRTGRHQHLARELATQGWHTVVIAASTDHPSGRQTITGRRLRERGTAEGHEFVWLRGVDYSTSRRRRLLDMMLFTLLVMLPGSFRGVPRPDVVVGGSVHPFAAWAASVVALRLRVPFVFEPRDLWPETLVQFGALRPGGAVTRAMQWLESRIVRRASLVVSPLAGVGRYYAERGHDVPFLWVPNGVSPEATHDAPTATVGLGEPAADEPAADETTVADHESFEVVYLGSMGRANALEAVIDAFDLAATSNPRADLRLTLVGDGPARPDLEARAGSSASADRISFVGQTSQAEARRHGLRADCLVANVAPLRLYDYGLSLNKLTEYLMLARPVVLGARTTGDPVTASNAGIRVDGDDVAALADSLLQLAATSRAEREAMGARGRAHVLAEYDYATLAGRLAPALDLVARAA
ncbi:glycosyltransferase family 4 protein [Frigoribacterium sp. 2-23]|uniref:glycosyltransferase family 4 protein n=1 Tax=Frigoribacterium sp. 2-23 TaxID=3415006 RepID=UPI003C6EFA0A